MNLSFTLDYHHQVANQSQIIKFFGAFPIEGRDVPLDTIHIIAKVGSRVAKQAEELKWRGITDLTIDEKVPDHEPSYYIFQSQQTLEKDGTTIIMDKIKQFLQGRSHLNK